MTVYYKMQQILLQNATAILLQHATEFYLQNVPGFLLKNRTVLLQNANVTTNCDNAITKCDNYYKTATFQPLKMHYDNWKLMTFYNLPFSTV